MMSPEDNKPNESISENDSSIEKSFEEKVENKETFQPHEVSTHDHPNKKSTSSGMIAVLRK